MLLVLLPLVYLSGCWSLALPGLNEAVIAGSNGKQSINPTFAIPPALQPTRKPNYQQNSPLSFLQPVSQEQTQPKHDLLSVSQSTALENPVQLSLSQIIPNMNVDTLQALIDALNTQLIKDQHSSHNQEHHQNSVNAAGALQDAHPNSQLQPNGISNGHTVGINNGGQMVSSGNSGNGDYQPTQLNHMQNGLQNAGSEEGMINGLTSVSQHGHSVSSTGISQQQMTGGTQNMPVQISQTVNGNQQQAQMYTNPLFMMTSGMGSHNSQNMATQMQSTMSGSVGNQASQSEFDPNTLMEKLLKSNYNPTGYNTQQHFVSTNQWNFASQPSAGSASTTTNGQIELTPPMQGQNVSNSGSSGQSEYLPIASGQINFEPGAMMTSLGEKEQKFSFDPDKLNAYGNGFHPGLMPLTSERTQVPQLMFNADVVNKQLMTYIDNHQEQQEHQQQQQQKQQTTNPFMSFNYDPDTFNRPMINSVPKTYLQFMGENPNQAGKKDVKKNTVTDFPQTTVQTLPENHKTNKPFSPGAIYPGGSNSFSNVGPTYPLSYTSTFDTLSFNPDRLNSNQNAFNPDVVMHNLFSNFNNPISHSVLGRNKKQLRKVNIPVNATNIINNSSRISNTNNTTAILTITTSTPITVPTNKPTTTRIDSTTHIPTTPRLSTTTDDVEIVSSQSTSNGYNSVFNPNEANSISGQFIFDFKPGQLMSYVKPPAGQTNNLVNFAFNPNQHSQESTFNPGVSPMMSALTQPENTGVSDQNQENTDYTGTGFNMGAVFDPSEVNNARMSFNLNEQMGFNTDAGEMNAMFDPIKVNMEAIQNPLQNTSTYESNFYNGLFSLVGEESAFAGSFDPNEVNMESISNPFDGKHNSSANSYMAMFLGKGGTGMDFSGGLGASAFGGSFNPADVNNAVFNPDDVNKAQMNFDPTDMLKHNPGYDEAKAKDYTFDPVKINQVHMNFQPPWLNTDSGDHRKENETSSLSSSELTSNSGFVPGQLSPYSHNGKQTEFNPSSVNDAHMLFSPGNMIQGSFTSDKVNDTKGQDTFDPTAINNQAHMLFNPMSVMGDTKGDAPVPSFDANAVNNAQMNFNPSIMMGNLGGLMGSEVSNSVGDNLGHSNSEMTNEIPHVIAADGKNKTLSSEDIKQTE